jgi:hypothetical protein
MFGSEFDPHAPRERWITCGVRSFLIAIVFPTSALIQKARRWREWEFLPSHCHLPNQSQGKHTAVAGSGKLPPSSLHTRDLLGTAVDKPMTPCAILDRPSGSGSRTSRRSIPCMLAGVVSHHQGQCSRRPSRLPRNYSQRAGFAIVVYVVHSVRINVIIPLLRSRLHHILSRPRKAHNRPHQLPTLDIVP